MAATRPDIRTKRVYEPASPSDGARILVDRVWPRGMSEERARADLWLKEVAPSTALRKWYAHEVERWPEFTRRYARELDERPEEVSLLLMLAAEGPLTLLFSAHDPEHNQAVALRSYLLELAAGR